MKILMVENDRRFVETVIGEFLREHEVVVIATVSGALARPLGPFDVLLVDYDLDDAKGDEFVRAVRATFRGRIIAISSHADGNEALIRAGADDACSKMRFDAIAAHLRT